MNSPPEKPLVFTLGTSQTFRLGGTGLDKIQNVKVTAKSSSVSWSASIGPEKSPTSLLVMATPSLVDGGELPSEGDQVLISPVGSDYSLLDTFVLNESIAIHCTVTSDGTTVYTPNEQLSLVAQYAV